MRTNLTKAKLARGEPVFGGLVFLKDPAAVELMGQAGLDYAVIDMEHTALDVGDVQAMVRGAETVGITPIVRVSENNPKLILRVLEAGAQGIMIPSVQGKDDAHRAVGACRYAPEGVRGTCRMARSAGFGSQVPRWADHVRESNDEILVVGLVEDRAGAREIEGIVEELDLVIVGRGDLSTDLGVSGKVDHPTVMEVVERAAAAAQRAGRPVGQLCYGTEDGKRWLDQGYRFLMYTIDVYLLFNAYASWVGALRDTGVSTPPAGRRG